MRTSVLRAILSSTLLLWLATSAAAQTSTVLTLDEALRRAEAQSESMTIAGAGQSRAFADLRPVNSPRYPQVSFTGTHGRTPAFEFSCTLDNSHPGRCDRPGFREPPITHAQTLADIDGLVGALRAAVRHAASVLQAVPGAEHPAHDRQAHREAS